MPRTKVEINKIAQDYGAVVSEVFDDVKIYLFGSYAKDCAKDWSDIDLAVVSADFENISQYTAVKMLNKLKRKVNLEISAIALTPSDINDPALGAIEYEVAKYGQIVYS
jgi:predicted nucleotidyltransferase